MAGHTWKHSWQKVTAAKHLLAGSFIPGKAPLAGPGWSCIDLGSPRSSSRNGESKFCEVRSKLSESHAQCCRLESSKLLKQWAWHWYAIVYTPGQ